MHEHVAVMLLNECHGKSLKEGYLITHFFERKVC